LTRFEFKAGPETTEMSATSKLTHLQTSEQRWPLQQLGSAHAKFVHSRRVQVLAEQFAELIPEGSSVLDVGCGDGLIDALVLKRRPDLRIRGVDVLVRPDTQIPVAPFDGQRLPFGDATWDTVVFCDVLHHTVDPPAMLAEGARVARRHVVIKDHSVEGFLARPTLRFMDFVGNAPHGVVLPYNYLTPLEWRDAFQACRLSTVKERRDLGLYPKLANWVFGRRLHFIGVYEIAR
jgi:SAM-dependent methyltransferase